VGNANDSPNMSGSSDQIFGGTLRTLRRAAGLTQAELAERAHLSVRGLSDLERGINRHPRRETLLTLADALGLADEERARFFAAARCRPPLPRGDKAPAGSESEPEPGLPSQMADIQIFLIADVRGYTTYTYEHRDEDAAQLALRFASIAGAAVQAHGSQVLEVRGDEVLVVFASARTSLRAAVALQEQVAQASLATPEQPIRCGIGLEAGEAIAVAGGYRGLAINLAARLCAQAGPGIDQPQRVCHARSGHPGPGV
jgi:transcriptional regulator with XRE-family HTH domain